MNIRCFVAAAAAVTAPGSSGRHSGRETIGGVLKLDFNSYIFFGRGGEEVGGRRFGLPCFIILVLIGPL